MTSKRIHKKNHPAEILRTMQLAMPVVIGMVASFSMNFVDTVMAGRLPDKEIALAGIATGGAIWSAVLMFMLGVLMALQPVVAQLDGAGDRAAGGAAGRQGMWIALAVSVPFALILLSSGPLLRMMAVGEDIVPTAISYTGALSWGAPATCLLLMLRFFSEGSGYTRPTMYMGLLGIALNVPLNYILMFGKLGLPAMGAQGCGIATSIVIWSQLLMTFLIIRLHGHFREFELFSRWDWPQWEPISKLLRVGLPIGTGIFVEGSLFVGAALLIARLGALPASAHLIAINFSALMFMVPLGVASAVTTRVGNALGRGEPDAARYAGLVGVAIVLFTQTISASIMLLAPQFVVRIYTDDAAITAIAVSLLFYSAIFQYADGIQICAAGALRGLKDTLVPMFINIFSFFLIGLSVGYYLTFNQAMGPAGMWIGMIVGLSFGAVLLMSRFLFKSSQLIRTFDSKAPPATISG
ncbi:MAG: MATE family efflux transporter [Gammaproteobacteria bacterium]|nr:MATE family efflux transporter [Gammaproteobacteria bacterium]